MTNNSYFDKFNTEFALDNQINTDSSQVYVNVVRAICRLSYKPLCIINYKTLRFLYVSDNPFFFCGHSSEYVLDKGYDFFFKNVSTEDLIFLKEINSEWIRFISNLPVDERMLCSISYVFNLGTDQQYYSKPILIKHQLTPISLDENGNVHLVLCLISLPECHLKHSAYITIEGKPFIWSYAQGGKKWNKSSIINLSDAEKKVIALSHEGMTMQDISKEMNKSIDTIKYYKRCIFQKLDVKHITEAIAFATQHKLI